jgi:putative nucleotidyltransferase with HDIG domain
MTLMQQAQALLEEWVQAESLRKHCYAVAASMRHFARLNGADDDLWGAVGLLHDLDYERHPNLERSPTGHPFVAVAHLRETGWSEEVTRAILAHAWEYSDVAPESQMEKTLVAVDELSSFVIAVALVRASKSIFDVDLPAVKKKMKDKAFARAVNREEIAHGAERLGVPLDELIGQVIVALRENADQLGVRGVEAPSA